MARRISAKAAIDTLKIADLPSLLVGAETVVPTLHGPRKYVNFDNAASTPTFTPIVDSVNDFLRWYSNVHRGTGFKSQLSSWAFEESRDIVTDFIGADLDKHCVIFTKNSTEAINKMANRSGLTKKDIILTTLMEHHSNELPWRRVGKVVHVGLNPDGTISKDDFQARIKEYGDRIKMVAITGASNVTGYINDIDYFAREAHKIGARILMDGAQLVPHRPVDMKPQDPNCYLDFMVFSAHKMYAPFGTGVLVADRKVFEDSEPDTVGGGVVDIVTLEEAYWSDLPDKEEAGTPDIVGVVALAKAIRMFQALGWEAVIKHEAELTAYALTELKKIDGVKLYGDLDPDRAAHRLGVVSFNVRDLPHALTAAILSYEGAIGVRSGCFCAHSYVKNLLEVNDEDDVRLQEQILSRDRSNIPGAVRASFGLYNTKEEIDRLILMVRKIAEGEYREDYVLDRESGDYTPRGFELPFEQYYKL